MNDRTTVVTPDEDAELSEQGDDNSTPVDKHTSDSVSAVPDSARKQVHGTAESSTDGDVASDGSAAGAALAGKSESAAGEGDSAGTEDNSETSSDGAADTAGKPRFRRRPPTPRPVTAVLLLLLVAAVVCAAVFGWKLKARNDDAAAGQAAMAAAKDYAVALTSIDSAHIDGDFGTVLNGATGQFKDMYSQSATQLKPLLLQAKSVSKGHVVAASVQSVSGDHAVVMLFVDAEITNVTNPTPRVDRNRILMTMDRVGGQWLASKVDLP
ncbi:hypothetical protein [Nocardia vaccinii]|uniref:hypothetical protein n=1 Tax=Nocardia vaccinii TaxID=1822 RepID=UPI00082D4D11|nr:hypothetical protein [Nocardia vaccinii]